MDITLLVIYSLMRFLDCLYAGQIWLINGEEEAKLEQKYHSIGRSSKEISKVPPLSDKWEIYEKLQSLPRIVHLHAFIDVVFDRKAES
ncbi:hypothetical protein H5410_064113 [Solanum commersonii]|uniref:Uncharacterized protein n=1 Tax=Solanum commersonii TaxID=4109 RepID=A0A9J5W076_SOLCO|nr:hypothetical protein H5410_064113 [Solanum commersonii]